MPVLIKRVTNEHDAALVALYGSLSPATRDARLKGRGPSARHLWMMLAVDHVDRNAVVAMFGGRAVGHAMFVRNRNEPTVADLGIVVHDESRREGIGMRLVRSSPTSPAPPESSASSQRSRRTTGPCTAGSDGAAP